MGNELRPPWRDLPALLSALPESDPLTRSIRQLQSGTSLGFVPLPPISGLDRLAFIRWLFRGWAASGATGRPLLILDPARFPSEPESRRSLVTDSFELGSRGWMALGPGWAALGSEAELGAAAQAHAVVVFAAVEGPPIVVQAALASRINREDVYHMVEVDPSLVAVRASLEALCRQSSLVHILGPTGSGRRSLARWVHARLDDRPLAVIRAGGRGERPGPGQWVLIEEPDEVEAEQLSPLRRRLDDQGLDWSAPAGFGAQDAPPRLVHPALDGIIGDSPPLRKVLAQATRSAQRSRAVLVQGERGTGKEDLARAIHALSGRSGRLVTIDVSACPETLVDAMLFGVEKGAFTGAGPRKGAFREADRGTLFIDEFGNLDTAVQKKLLRAIQFGEIQPLGADFPIRLDVQVVAATNADLDEMARRGEFRDDLIDRFAWPDRLRLPPLRDRAEDVLPLAAHFVRPLRGGATLPPDWIDPAAARILEEWRWPGNIRELRGLIEAAADLALGGPIEPRHLHHLAPDERRDTPMIVVSSEPVESWAASAGLRRRQTRELEAVTLQVPPLVDRGPAALRCAVLGALEGRPISRTAMDLLCSRPGWGNYAGLHRTLQMLRSQLPGAITVEALRRLLPAVVEAVPRAIRTVLHPQLDEAGELHGFIRDFETGAVVVGRAGGWSALSHDTDRRQEARKAAIRTLTAGEPVSFLQLGHVPGLSRAHLLLGRGPGGLELHALPEVGLKIRAGSLSSPELRLVVPGSPIPLGAGGELRVEAVGGELLVRLFVFAGATAWQDGQGAMADRLRGEDPAPGMETLDPSLQRIDPALRPGTFNLGPVTNAGLDRGLPRRGGGPWRLNGAERQALIELIVDVVESGAAFAPRIREFAEAWAERPDRSRLSEYLLRTRNWTQQLTNLSCLDVNDELRAELAQSLQALRDPASAIGNLPSRIRELLPEPGGV